MAYMIPSALPFQIKSQAEKDLFELFKSSKGTENWIVLYSLSEMNNVGVFEGESDFVVIAPDLGTFVLEVKGGGVSRDRNGWLFTNRYGETNRKIRGPFEQAKDGMHTCLNYVRDHYRPAGQYYRLAPAKTLFGYGAMFPDVVVGQRDYGIDIDTRLIYDRSYNHDVVKFIKQLSDYWTKGIQNARGWSPSLPSERECQVIAETLRPSFELAPSMNFISGEMNKALQKLTQEEYRAIDAMKYNPRVLFFGNAGTGKTSVALELARRAEAHKIILVCYNKQLANYFEKYVKAYGIADKFLFVGSMHAMMLQTIRRAEIVFNPAELLEKDFYTGEMYELFCNALVQLQDFSADFLIVDEFQDLLDEGGDIMQVFDILLKDGVQKGKFALFADFNNQEIYKKPISFDRARNLISMNQTVMVSNYELLINCRNSKEISQYIEYVSDVSYPDTLDSASVHVSPEFNQYSSMEEECKKIHSLLDKLLKSGLPSKSIVILSPKAYENSCLSIGEKIPEYSLERKGVTFETIHSFKGLESDCVILADVEGYNDPKYKSLVYIGMSRAKSFLYVFETADAQKERTEIILSKIA